MCTCLTEDFRADGSSSDNQCSNTRAHKHAYNRGLWKKDSDFAGSSTVSKSSRKDEAYDAPTVALIKVHTPPFGAKVFEETTSMSRLKTLYP
jgi:hypothetical protein